MSVWTTDVSASRALAGAEGVLVSVSVAVEPPRLEQLLDALAQLEFPINPQIYHNAALVYRDTDRREKTEPITLVEFPAYEGRLREIRGILECYGFPASSLEATAMLGDGQSEAPPDSGNPLRVRRMQKHLGAACQ